MNIKNKTIAVSLSVLLLLSLTTNGYLFYSLRQQQAQSVSLIEQQAAQFEEFSSEYAAQIEKLIADHAAAIEELNQDHTNELAELQASYDAKLAMQEAAVMEDATTTNELSSIQTEKPQSSTNNTQTNTGTAATDPMYGIPSNEGHEGQVYIPGFGWIDDEGGNGEVIDYIEFKEPDPDSVIFH